MKIPMKIQMKIYFGNETKLIYEKHVNENANMKQ